MLRAYRAELMAAGALVRVGRELVVIGERYSRWLQRQAASVPDFKSNANRGPTGAEQPVTCPKPNAA